jgi:zinc transport system ATP-binding protein
MLVEIAGAGVRRGDRWLVEGIDLTIRPGEIVTLIGPNGSGKSTTARLVTGVVRPDRGSVFRRPGLTIGYVPQKLAIDWTLPLTVERLMSLTARHARSDVAAALTSVGIPHLAREPVQQLSGGEFQRALLARAMLRKPDLLVLDEPVQGVDFSGEVALYELISRIRNDTGCGILMISHDLHVVMAATDTVVCLNGHVCCTGTPQTVVRSPEYLKLFGPRAAETLAIYRHDHDHTHLPDGRVLDAGHDGHHHDHDHHHDHAHHHHGHHHTHPGHIPAPDGHVLIDQPPRSSNQAPRSGNGDGHAR